MDYFEFWHRFQAPISVPVSPEVKGSTRRKHIEADSEFIASILYRMCLARLTENGIVFFQSH